VPVYPIKNKEAIPYISKVGINLENPFFSNMRKASSQKMRTGFLGGLVI